MLWDQEEGVPTQKDSLEEEMPAITLYPDFQHFIDKSQNSVSIYYPWLFYSGIFHPFLILQQYSSWLYLLWHSKGLGGKK